MKIPRGIFQANHYLRGCRDVISRVLQSAGLWFNDSFRMSQKDCIFCRIVAGEIPAARVHEDAICVAFDDVSPQAPVHLLVIPREHIDSLDGAEDGHQAALGHMLLTCRRIAREKGFAEDGYRVVINTNRDGGQTVFHLHLHLLAGRPFVFPPG